jgi:hypothetical protein
VGPAVAEGAFSFSVRSKSGTSIYFKILALILGPLFGLLFHISQLVMYLGERVQEARS